MVFLLKMTRGTSLTKFSRCALLFFLFLLASLSFMKYFLVFRTVLREGYWLGEFIRPFCLNVKSENEDSLSCINVYLSDFSLLCVCALSFLVLYICPVYYLISFPGITSILSALLLILS